MNKFIYIVVTAAISLSGISFGMQDNGNTFQNSELITQPTRVESLQNPQQNVVETSQRENLIEMTQDPIAQQADDSTVGIAQNNNRPTNFTLRFDRVEEINQYGQDIIDHAASDIYKNITTEQEQQLTHFVMARNFSPYKVSLVWWRFVRAVCDPISCLAQLATTVLPMLSFGSDGNSFDTYQKVIISICGVVSLSFGQICGYAKNRVREQEKMEILLHAVKSGRIQLNDGIAQAEEDDQIGAQV